MSLTQAIEELNVKKLKSLIPESYTEAQQADLTKRIKSLVGVERKTRQNNNQNLSRVLQLAEELKRREDFSGHRKLFQEGPYSIDNLPKHKEFFKATKNYRETLLLGGNRCGKTTGGAVVCAVMATGDYYDWWDGIRYEGNTDIWAIGKTGQTTRDTVQTTLLGPPNAWGTGVLPAASFIHNGKPRIKIRHGIPDAVDTVAVEGIHGGLSIIGFKSYDQKASSFYGTAKNLVWLDEPCPDLVYSECLIRTMKLKADPNEGPRGGRLIHTITPKDGLTRLLADFLSSCELLAGAERIKGLEAMMKLQELEEAARAE